jgi:HlyD family secretion protein
MRVLNRKLGRDLRRLWLQALAIALVVAGGVATLVMAVGTYRSLEETRAAYYDRYEFADIFAHVRRAPKALARRIAEIDGVAAVSLRIVKLALLDMPMSKKRTRQIASAMLGLAIAAAGVWFVWPNPILVDTAPAVRAAMAVTVDEEAKTRVRNVYTVSAPVSGTVQRSPGKVGDQVVANLTTVAVMRPASPSLHDPRTHEELQAALRAAESAVSIAEAERRRLEAALRYARSEFERAQALARNDGISRMALDRAKFEVDANEAALASAVAQLGVRRSERDSVAARLRNPSAADMQSGAGCCIQIRAPVSGRILRVLQESEAAVAAGTPLVEVGNPQDLEIVAEILSSDAVQMKAGAAVLVDGWGGRTLRGRVSRIEPVGFVKVSALGIEENRVRTIIDLVDPPTACADLGHNYGVRVHRRSGARLTRSSSRLRRCSASKTAGRYSRPRTGAR